MVSWQSASRDSTALVISFSRSPRTIVAGARLPEAPRRSRLSRNLPGLGGGEIGERSFESMASLLDSGCIVLLDSFTD